MDSTKEPTEVWCFLVVGGTNIFPISIKDIKTQEVKRVGHLKIAIHAGRKKLERFDAEDLILDRVVIDETLDHEAIINELKLSELAGVQAARSFGRFIGNFGRNPANRENVLYPGTHSRG
jgi:hypothetical protein